MNIITRKIQLIIKDSDVKGTFKKLYNWNEIVFRAYNYTASHLYFQQNISEFFYFTEDFHLNLSNKLNKKNIPGVLKTSKRNTTYQLLSSKFKGEIPTSILACLNQNIHKNFQAERKDYFSGKKSLRTYRRGVPIPISSTSIRKLSLDEKGKNYLFRLYGINFKTNFGKDLSDNKSFFDNLIKEKYKLADSSIQLKGNKIFLLAVFKFESINEKLDFDKSIQVALSLNEPIKFLYNNKTYRIGNKEEFLFQRLAIKGARSRHQKSLKFNKGGRGRKKKLMPLNYWNNKEHHYIQTKLHKYSRELINFCLKKKIGNIIFEDQSEEMKSLEVLIKEIESDKTLSYGEKKKLIDENTFLISNWSYYGLIDKINYKAKQFNINVH